MGFKNIANKLSQSAHDYADKQKLLKKEREDEKERLAIVEQDRKEGILAGNLQPISISVNLDEGEIPYAEFNATRFAMVEKVVEHTTVQTKKKGVVGRAIVGGVLLGPLGALGGAATAGSKGKSITNQSVNTVLEAVDSGQLILTNQRVLFIGGNIVSVPFGKILAYNFSNIRNDLAHVSFKYPEMMYGEFYKIAGVKASDAELYYMGITGKKMLTRDAETLKVSDDKNSTLKTVGNLYIAPYKYAYKAGKSIGKKIQ